MINRILFVLSFVILYSNNLTSQHEKINYYSLKDKKLIRDVKPVTILLFNNKSCLQCFHDLIPYINDSVVIVINDANTFLKNLENYKFVEKIYPKNKIFYSKDSFFSNIITPSFILISGKKTVLYNYNQFYINGKLSSDFLNKKLRLKS